MVPICMAVFPQIVSHRNLCPAMLLSEQGYAEYQGPNNDISVWRGKVVTVFLFFYGPTPLSQQALSVYLQGRF